MGPWVVPAISAGGSLLQSMIGRKQTTERRLSPEAQAYLRMLYGELEGETPSYVTRPIEARWGSRIQDIKEETGEALGVGSGLGTAQVMKAETAQGREMGEAKERHRASILRAITSIVGGAGTQETTMPFDVGAPLEDVGWAIWAATHGKKTKGEGGGYGGGMQYYPGFLGGQ